jgi:hypothetical protein
MANTVVYMSDHGQEPISKYRNSTESASSQREYFSEQLEEHLLLTTKQIQCNKFTLTFDEEMEENGFIEYTIEKLLLWWRFVGPLGICFAGLFQLIFYLLVLQQEEGVGQWKELIIIPIVYVPLLLVTCIVIFGDQRWVKKYIQYLSFIYIVFIGPVFNFSRSLLFRRLLTNYGFVTAPFYITILYCFTYFLRLRFIFCVVLFLVAYPAWFIVAFFAYQDSHNSSLLDRVALASSLEVLVSVTDHIF